MSEDDVLNEIDSQRVMNGERPIKTAEVLFNGKRCVFSERSYFLEEMALFFDEAQGDESITVNLRFSSRDDLDKLEEFSGW